jgi:hypothetical protein
MTELDLTTIEESCAHLERDPRWLEPEAAWEICVELQSLIGSANQAFDVASRMDTDWHSAVFSGQPVPDDFGQVVLTTYREIADLFERLERLVARIEQMGYQVVGAGRLWSNHAELKGILTPDAEFFDDEALAARQDEAIDSHRRGETVEFEEMGD